MKSAQAVIIAHALTMVIVAPAGLFAAEESKPGAQTPAEPPASGSPTDGQEVASRILSSLAEASQRLEDGVIDSSTIALQQSAADDIKALLENLRQNSSSSSSRQSASQSSSQNAPQPSSRSSAQPNENRDAAQSNEDARGGDSAQPEDEPQRRRNLALSVWGHLPPKMQEELERSFSERFAPKYEELIRRYYEALAERPRRTP